MVCNGFMVPNVELKFVLLIMCVANYVCVSPVCFFIAACLVPMRLKSSVSGPSLNGPHRYVKSLTSKQVKSAPHI